MYEQRLNQDELLHSSKLGVRPHLQLAVWSEPERAPAYSQTQSGELTGSATSADDR
jgi:hypothetical protein